MSATVSSNMNLLIPGIGTESGPDWASDLNASLTLVDQHNHSSGQGVQIQPNGMNINSDLTFQSNNAIALRTARFTAQSAALVLATDIGCLYVVGNELYYNDVSGGNHVQITTNGNVNAGAGSINGLPSGTASASFAAGTFVFQSATSTAANIDGESFILRNSTANSKGLTLQPPAAMASNFALTLPSIPVAQNFLSIDASGNIAAFTPTSAGVTGAMMAAATVAKTNLVALGQQTADGGGSNSTTSYALVTGLTLSLTTTGRPVFVAMVSQTGTSAPATVTAGKASATIVTADIQLRRDGSPIATYEVSVTAAGNSGALSVSIPASMFTIDIGASATAHTYEVYAKASTSGTTVVVDNARLVAYEL